VLLSRLMVVASLQRMSNYLIMQEMLRGEGFRK
jgi:hypothetical protein